MYIRGSREGVDGLWWGILTDKIVANRRRSIRTDVRSSRSRRLHPLGESSSRIQLQRKGTDQLSSHDSGRGDRRYRIRHGLYG